MALVPNIPNNRPLF